MAGPIDRKCKLLELVGDRTGAAGRLTDERRPDKATPTTSSAASSDRDAGALTWSLQSWIAGSDYSYERIGLRDVLLIAD